MSETQYKNNFLKLKIAHVPLKENVLAVKTVNE